MLKPLAVNLHAELNCFIYVNCNIKAAVCLVISYKKSRFISKLSLDVSDKVHIKFVVQPV